LINIDYLSPLGNLDKSVSHHIGGYFSDHWHMLSPLGAELPCCIRWTYAFAAFQRVQQTKDLIPHILLCRFEVILPTGLHEQHSG
jgi:hypothetical protein